MARGNDVLPTVDLGPYLNPSSTPSEREQVIAQVREACSDYGFFQIKGHGIPLASQQGLLRGMHTFFSQPKEEKMKVSFLTNASRRGYEASGDSMRDGDALPDAKEAFFIGTEEPVIEPPGFHGPNLWPDLPREEFRTPAYEYFEQTFKLGKTLWEIFVLGLGHSPSLLDQFAKRPIVVTKMIRYPASSQTRQGQFGIGAHSDFGGVTILLQQAGKHGLEVWHDETETWLPVPAIEDVLIVNAGDMIQKWSAGQYKSARHRVINKTDSTRLSCATFWHGDVNATNPLDPNDSSQETVGDLLFKRFEKQYKLKKIAT